VTQSGRAQAGYDPPRDERHYPLDAKLGHTFDHLGHAVALYNALGDGQPDHGLARPETLAQDVAANLSDQHLFKLDFVFSALVPCPSVASTRSPVRCRLTRLM